MTDLSSVDQAREILSDLKNADEVATVFGQFDDKIIKSLISILTAYIDLAGKATSARNEALEEAKANVCFEIKDIMQTYREQEAEGSVDTPGGLEHMGDVWRLLSKWDESLKTKTPPKPEGNAK